MSVRAFVARDGWTKSPISAQEWCEAARAVPELQVQAQAGAEDVPVVARLRSNPRQRVSWVQGYLYGEHVDHRLVAVMFNLADRLGAQVYSEHRHIYHDVDDWDRRTRRRRARAARHQPGPVMADALPGDLGRGAALAVFAGMLLGIVMLGTWALNN